MTVIGSSRLGRPNLTWSVAKQLRKSVRASRGRPRNSAGEQAGGPEEARLEARTRIMAWSERPFLHTRRAAQVAACADGTKTPSILESAELPR